jgi:hypothetical protein
MALPKWRKLTWVFVIVQVLFLAWIIGGLAASGSSCSGLKGDDLDFCQAGEAIGASIGVGIIVFLWVLVDIILGITWLVTNKKKTRECPVCGTDVKKGVIVCTNCGYNWATGARPEPTT